MQPFRIPSHTYQSGIAQHHQPLPLVPARNVTQLKMGKIQRTNQTDAERGDFFIVSDRYERYRAQPLSPFVSTNHGVVRRPKIIPKTDEEDQNGPIENGLPQGEQDSFVVFGFGNGDIRNVFILGSIIPQVSEMQFGQTDFIDRHHTDSVKLENNDGNRAEYMPDGTGVVIGEPGFDHPADLDPANNGEKNFDWESLPWALRKRHDNQYTISQQSGSTRLHFDTKGNVVMQRPDVTIQMHEDGKISLTSSGPQGINAPEVTFNSPKVSILGDFHVAGNIYAENIESPNGLVPGIPVDAVGSGPSPGNPVKPTIPYVKKEFKTLK